MGKDSTKKEKNAHDISGQESARHDERERGSERTITSAHNARAKRGAQQVAGARGTGDQPAGVRS